MSAWVWITIGVACFLALSTVVAVTLAAILGNISRDVSQLLKTELWAVSPPTRAKARVARA